MNNLNSVNNNGVPYYFPADIAKEGQQYVRISNFFKTRVGDNGKILPFKWYDQGRVMNVHGFIPFIQGLIGKFSTDDNDKVIMAPDASYREWQGSTANAHDGGFIDYILEDQMFPQEGIFKGHFGLKDGNGNVLTSVNIIFEVLGNDLRVGETVKYYVAELENLKNQYKIEIQNALTDLQQKIKSTIDKYEGSIEFNIGALKKLSATASSISAELDALDVTTKQDFTNLRAEIVNRLGSIQPEPVVYANIESLQKQYPNGSSGVYITADDRCLAYFDGSEWKKGIQFGLDTMSLLERQKMELNVDTAFALLDKVNGKTVYNYYSDSIMWNNDNRFTRICQLPAGYQTWSIILKSQNGTYPNLLIAELQDDNTYLAKSVINLKVGTGDKLLTSFNYNVTNQNTYAFIGGSSNIFQFSSESVPANKFIQVEFNSVKLNEKMAASEISNTNLAGINASIIGYQDTKATYTNLSNALLTQTTTNSDHYWNVLNFQKGEYLDRAVVKTDANDVTLEIREKVDGKYVLKKHITASSYENGQGTFNLNYLTENDGVLFVSGHIFYSFSDDGVLIEYNATPDNLELSPTENVHTLMPRIDIYTEHVDEKIPSLYSALSHAASTNVYNDLIAERSHTIYSNLTRGDLTLVPDLSRFSDHYWNVLSFQKGDSLDRAVVKSDANDVALEIREKINDKYVLKKHITASSYENGKGTFKLNYLAENDGVLFVTGSAHYTEGQLGTLLEYVGSDSSDVSVNSNVHVFVWAMDVYQSDSLISTIVQNQIKKKEEQDEADLVIKTTTQLPTKKNWLPRFIKSKSNFELSGRWYNKNIGGKNYYVTNNCGAQINFLIQNATYFTVDWKSMYQNDNARWAYSIDGNTFNSISTSQTRVDLSDESKHIVQIVTDAVYQDLGKWTDGNGFAFSTIESDGQTIGLKNYDPLIMYLGDSITEGIRTLGMDEKGPGCSVLHAYSWLSARQLNAHPYIVGYGGTGLYNHGSFNTTDYAVDWMTQSVPEKELYPNLIVVNIGTNDGAIDDLKFSSLYSKLLQKLIIKYPGVLIACMIPFNQTRRAVITDTVANIPNCITIDTQDWNISTTDGTHPDANGSLIAAARLASELDKLSWRNNVFPEVNNLSGDQKE